MKFIDYLKDKAFSLLLFFITIMVIMFLLVFLDAHILLVVSIPLLIFMSYCLVLIHDYIKKKTFFNYLNLKLEELDQKYFITEIVNKANFLEANLLIEYLYEINKSYLDNLNKYKYNALELKEYIELWCHEIKTPIATSNLIIANNPNKITNSIKEELEKLENYVEQVLFYARSENVDKDYIITKTNLKDVVQTVVKKNKKDLLTKKIKVDIFKDNVFIESDSKWLEFIINQILINSIKYSKNKDALISFTIKDNKNNIMLFIKDNGIGIPSVELNKVFDKGFTGSNGRKKYNSTGIGLYLCKKLCDKLGHNINITSKENIDTIVIITFPNSSLTNEIK